MSNKIYLIMAVALVAGVFPGRAFMMSSEHYRIDADSINIGGVKQTSGSYKSEDTIGEVATGKSSGSSKYKISAGYQAMWDYPPGLSFAISNNSAALGTLSVAAAAKASIGFSVSSNATSGYAVQIGGTTLACDGCSDSIDALASPTASSPGQKQFGINLVANSDPSVGSNPSGGNGAAASGYDTTNQFKFVSGTTIAKSNIYSPNTAFVISFLGNITAGTVSGRYRTNLTLITTAKF